MKTRGVPKISPHPIRTPKNPSSAVAYGLLRSATRTASDEHFRPEIERREWDSNPRWAGPTTVFETVRFGRSRIPPSRNRLAAAAGGEEPRQQLGRLVGADSTGDRQLVVEAGVR